MKTMAMAAGKREAGVVFRPGRGGFTLLEVMVAMGVLLIGVCAGFYILMGTIRENRTSRMQILANFIISAKADELYSQGLIDKYLVGDLAPAAICHYANEFDGRSFRLGETGVEVDSLELAGGGGALIHRFPIGVADDPLRSDNEFKSRIVGTMVFHLDETGVDPVSGGKMIWRDLGINENGETLDRGFDLNLDGKITAPVTTPTLAILRLNPANLGIRQAPVDITITFYSDNRRSAEIYSLTRRIVLTEMKGGAGVLEGI
jgi:prepilin-type N-terminal cleavage/methylation domain-containing protein